MPVLTPESKEPSSAVTECLSLPFQSQTTVVPGLTVMSLGSYFHVLALLWSGSTIETCGPSAAWARGRARNSKAPLLSAMASALNATSNGQRYVLDAARRSIVGP